MALAGSTPLGTLTLFLGLGSLVAVGGALRKRNRKT
jgi:hypothetical protein